MLVGAGVILDAPDLAGFATFTILPLSLLVGLRRDLSLKRKLASISPLWYVMPIVLLVLQAANNPGHMLYFLHVTLCMLIFFACVGCLVKFYWTERHS